MTAIADRARGAPPQDARVIGFIEGWCRQTEGEHAGQLLRLRDWQRGILNNLFAVRPDGRRKHRQALIGMPRKNGKSALGAGLALYLLIGDDEPGAEVYSCAGDRDQARIVFGTAREMVEMDHDLSARLKLYRDTILDKKTNSVYRVLSAEAYTKEGLNPSAVIFDELHVQPNRELWDVMTMGSGTRRQPLVVAITTAGYDLEGTICGEKYQYGKKVESGEIDDLSFYFKWFEPSDPNCDWRDPAVWEGCNPAYGDFLYPEFLEQQAREKPEHVFRRYFLNQWTATEDAWIPYGVWDQCESDLDLDPALPLYVGIDIGIYVDATAVVAVQKQPDQSSESGNRFVVRAQEWENPYPPEHSLYSSWRTPYQEVKDYCRDLYARFPVPASEVDGVVGRGPGFYYDPYNFREKAEELEADGLTMQEWPQNDSRMIPVSSSFYEAIMKGEIAHDGDAALKRHVHAVTADQKPRGWRMSKPKGSKRKIDAAIATAIAVHMAKVTPAPGSTASYYETHELLVV